MLVSGIRTIIFYIALLVAVRLTGKRQIGEMEASEFVVTMLTANLATIPMEDLEMPIYAGLIPLAIVISLEVLLSIVCLHSVKLRRILYGKPVILIENGKILRKNLVATRVSLDELTELLRGKDVLSVDTVQYAILETNGELSVFEYPEFRPADAQTAGLSPQPQHLPYTLIADGYLYRENLKLMGRDERWLQKELSKHHATQKTTLLLTLDHSGKVLFIPKS